MLIGPIVFAVTGKGGVGKTTFTALLLKSLLDNVQKKILVIDADPATNLADALGIRYSTTVGQVIDKTKRDVEKKSDFYDGSALLEFRLWKDALIEESQFHFLAMGYTSGKGCYCMINDVLTYMLEDIKSFYDLIILDMDAGLEHISRNTKRPINLTFLITDPSFMGFQTVRRIIELARELQSPMEKFAIVGSMFKPPKQHKKLQDFADNLQIPLLGIIPPDETLAFMNLQGDPLLKIPKDSSAYQQVNQILRKLVENLELI